MLGRAMGLTPTVAWENGVVVMIDQRRLPGEEILLRCRDHHEVAAAIRDMAIRGAPAIGVAAALGLALGASLTRAEGAGLRAEWSDMCSTLAATRPTAVNLFWAIERMRRRFDALAGDGGETLRRALLAEALAIQQEDLHACHKMGDIGAELLPKDAKVLTHCNAGALATAGYGTALGVVRSAARLGKLKAVFADETRPWLQGARLTVWELMQDGIDATLIAEGAAGHLMARGRDQRRGGGRRPDRRERRRRQQDRHLHRRVLAKEHGVPFYVAAPRFDARPSTPRRAKTSRSKSGPRDEVTHVAGHRVAPEGVRVRNPAFDVTPHRYVTAIVCERGVARPPYSESLQKLVAS